MLVAFARCLQEELRSSDLLARIGGETFVIYLLAETQAEALAIAKRLCEKVAAMQIDQDGLSIPVTVSIGLAWVHGADLAAKAWLQKADATLYDAKLAGRNQVVLANP